MTRDLLDLDRVRQNFDRMREPVPDGIPDRHAAVVAPRDPFEVARSILVVLRADVLSRFSERSLALEPFLDRADALLVRMERTERAEPPGDAPVAAEGTPTGLPVAPDEQDAGELRQSFVQTLEHIEDLCEVFSRIARRR